MYTTKNVISDELITNDEFLEGIEILFKEKSTRDIFTKIAEELAELLVNIIKEANKPGKIATVDIIEEVVDVQMNLILLMKFLNYHTMVVVTHDKIAAMVKSKSFKYYKGLHDARRQINKAGQRGTSQSPGDA